MEQNVVLNVNDMLETYRYFVPTTKLKLLNLRQWLPLAIDSELAEISAYLVAKVMGDGNLDKSFTCRFIGQFNDLTKLKSIIASNYSLNESSLTMTFRNARGESYLLQVNDSLFGRFLYALGAPIGNKTKSKFLIPEWILSSEGCSRRFLRGLFDDELATIKIKRRKFFREAAFRLTKIEECQDNLIEFLTQIKALTESFSVSCSQLGKPHKENIQKDGNQTFSRCFRVLGNRRNILAFNDNIGFGLNKYKIEELKKCVDLINGAGKGIRTLEDTKSADFESGRSCHLGS